MALAAKAIRRRTVLALAASVLLAACSQTQRHNAAENEFTAWADEVERTSANGQTIPDFEEPANVLDRTVRANAH
jgi:ABC-type glycerol-3-phosphate transport system substrate-binding protein